MPRKTEQINGSVASVPLLTQQALEEWAASMCMDPALVVLDDEGYPCDDGEPMESYLHAFALIYAASVLDGWFRKRPDVLVGADMMVYDGEPGRSLSAAPDILVAFGASVQKERRSYKLWEDGPPPSFVMEILSITTGKKDMQMKPDIYARMGVAEYWLFDPHGRDIPGQLAGYRLRDGAYRAIPPLPDGSGYRSGALGLDIHVAGGALHFRDPATGKDLRSVAEAWQDTEDAQARHEESEAGRAEERAGRLKAEARIAELEAQLARQSGGAG